MNPNAAVVAIETIRLVDTLLEGVLQLQRISIELKAASDIIAAAHAQGRDISDEELATFKQKREDAIAKLQALPVDPSN